MAITRLAGGASGAPYFNGIAGSAIAVFDYILVTTLGWTKIYSGTNAADYREPVSGHSISIVDTAGTTFTMRAFFTQSALGTGTEPYPASATINYKSDVATSANRNWRLITNGTNLIMQIAANSINAYNGTQCGEFIWGDFVSRRTVGADAYTKFMKVTALSVLSSTPNSGAGGFGIHRAHNQISGSVSGGFMPLLASAGLGAMGNTSAGAAPSLLRNDIPLSSVGVNEANIAEIRGIIPGFWCPLFNITPRADGDTIDGTGLLAGKSFEFWRDGPSAGFFVETSNTW